MDAEALLHPRGPLAPGVYWRRRLLTLGAVVLVLFLAIRSCGVDGKPVASVSPSPTPTTTPSTTGTPSRTPLHPPSPSVATTPPLGPCQAADLVLSARADAQTYPAGRRPVLTIGIATKGRFPCTADVGQAAREIRITSGSERIWSSDDCSPGGGALVVTLRPGAAAVSFSVTWSRKRSAPGCPAGSRDAVPGTYRVVGRFGDQTSPGDTFTLG